MLVLQVSLSKSLIVDRCDSRSCARQMGDMSCGRGMKPSPVRALHHLPAPGCLWSGAGGLVFISPVTACVQGRKPASGVLKFCDGFEVMSPSFPGKLLVPQGVPGRTGVHRVGI